MCSRPLPGLMRVLLSRFFLVVICYLGKVRLSGSAGGACSVLA